MEIIMIEKKKHEKFENNFHLDVKGENLEKIIKGDTEIALWNTNIKVYPIGQTYHITHSYYKYNTYNVKVYGVAYIAGQIRGVFGYVEENSNSLCIIYMNMGETYDQFPTYQETHDQAQKCLGHLIFNDDGGTTKTAYQNATENLKKDMSQKSTELIELEKQLEFKAPFYGGPSEEAVEKSFIKNMEIMKEINKLIN